MSECCLVRANYRETCDLGDAWSVFYAVATSDREEAVLMVGREARDHLCEGVEYFAPLHGGAVTSLALEAGQIRRLC
jgi:hypothetical protein